MAIERDLRLISPQKNRHQAVFLFCRSLFKGFLQLLDLALMLGDFLKAGGNLLLDRFLADFGHLAAPFAVMTLTVSGVGQSMKRQSATGLLMTPTFRSK
ncbi:hypothetical protein JD505_07195 [Aeromonas hydrophila]|uniref:hypothetical protein n=1 Tax=Aeromonas hydrophila TaxID=644 RepID=UPI00191DC4F7|nr:hypothetical protein [Aeromonas hydrophila]MBL0569063.1 hypothetical protein [Aeromonas hydrophila]